MIKAVLFDMDGVLVDAVKLHQQAFIEAIAPYKHITEEEHMRDLNATPTKAKLEKLNIPEMHRENIYNRKQKYTCILIPKLIKPIPQVLNVVEELKKREINFAVCSNSITRSMELLLKHGGIEGHDFFISNQDVENPKPDPEMYLKAIEKMGFSKEEILIVEDAPTGLKAAYASGANVCKIGNPLEIGKVLEKIDKINNSDESKQDIYHLEQTELSRQRS